MIEFNFSIIIASVGRNSLTLVLDCIKNSTLHPREVIICLPEQDHYEFDVDYAKNNLKFELKIIKINTKSQTAQRLKHLEILKINFSCKWMMIYNLKLIFLKMAVNYLK